ncbi:E3 ubiquitin-protein ligase Godzilla [Onthophagus taurus]|uniref:E3 ubiquitin-protein ligase Godzilla n=1 Tax=Onthophagus taurus TaxID=166361 RepID=UPI000C20C190|nr:E3 ubiquitin-protein ligase RNF13-like [Onthophagus taurus]
MLKSQSPIFVLFIVYLSSRVVFGDIIVYDIAEHVAYNVLKDMPSTFGESIPFDGLEAMLTIANPVDACEAIEPPPTIHNFRGKWVALIARHNCTYERKVRMAQNAKFHGVIVHNIDSDNLIAMTATNTTGIYIPSVFIGAYDANYLKELSSRREFYIIITPDAPFNINTHLLLPFAIVVGILFIVMVIFMVVKCIKDRRRARRHRLPASALNKMVLHKFIKGDPYETCAICLDDFIEGEKLRVLPCAHAYHSKCIDPWLTNNRRVCPICKRKVFAQNEEPCSSDSDTDDDTTPLINASTNQNQSTTGGGTFTVTNEMERARLLLRARILQQMAEEQNFFMFPNSTIINGDSSSDSSDAVSHASRTDDVYVDTRSQNTSNGNNSDHDVVI